LAEYGGRRGELATLDDACYMAWGCAKYPPVTPFLAWLAGVRFFATLAVMVAALAVAESLLPPQHQHRIDAHCAPHRRTVPRDSLRTSRRWPRCRVWEALTARMKQVNAGIESLHAKAASR
jgi:hypothetical protein